MRWTEPRHSVVRRTKLFRTPARDLVLASLASALLVGAAWLLGQRWEHGVWAVRGGVVFGGTTGALVAVVGALHNLRLILRKRQRIDLGSQQFWIRGDREFILPYSTLRGYSILSSDDRRTLLLYPQSDGAFSIGIPSAVADEDIHAMIRAHALFVTIIDDQALKRPN